VERSSHGLIKARSWHLPGRTEETVRNHIRIAGALLHKNPMLQLHQPVPLISDVNMGGPHALSICRVYELFNCKYSESEKMTGHQIFNNTVVIMTTQQTNNLPLL
jgi:hypothetical protein